MTINEALDFLTKAKTRVGGDAVLVLSLTDSGIGDADIDSMEVIEQDNGYKSDVSGYVEVRCDHPCLIEEYKNFPA